MLELSCCKYPVEYFLPRELDNNRESLLSLIEEAQKGVRGLVEDRDSSPVAGAVVGVGEEDGQQWAGKNVSSSERAEYWRLLSPGSYILQAWAGCLASPPTSITVTDIEFLTVNITLSQNICL